MGRLNLADGGNASNSANLKGDRANVRKSTLSVARICTGCEMTRSRSPHVRVLAQELEACFYPVREI